MSLAVFLISITIAATSILLGRRTIHTEALEHDTRSAVYSFTYTLEEASKRTTVKNLDLRESWLETESRLNTHDTMTTLTSSASLKQNSELDNISLYRPIDTDLKNFTEGISTLSLSVENNGSRAVNVSYPEIESIRNDSPIPESLHMDDRRSLDDVALQNRSCAGQTNRSRIALVSNETEKYFLDYQEITDGNTTDLKFAFRSPPDNGETPIFVEILGKLEVTCTLIGTVANLFAIIALFSHHDGFSRAILTLLRHQTTVDFLVCAIASTLLLEPFNWLTGFYYVDVFVCHVWHGEALYLTGVIASCYNLVLVAYERYLAVCKPFRHLEISSWPRRNFIKVFVGLYVLSIANAHVALIRTKLKNGTCVNEYEFDGPAMSTYFFTFLIFNCITVYFLPAVLMGICYVSVLMQLRRRVTDVSLGRSNRLDRANGQITRTALAGTIVLVCTVGYDLICALLRYVGVVDNYQWKIALRKVGVFLSELNSFSTPFMYAAAMPIFRRSVLRTLCRLVGRTRFRGSGRSRSSTVVGEATGRSSVV